MKKTMLFACMLTLLLVACGEEREVSQTTSTDATVTSGGRKPQVTVPDGPPPTTLKISDVNVGTGAEAVAGKTITVHYVGVSYSTKQQFDASWDRGQPFTFQLGSGGVIKGWDQGVPGMKVGGRRQLVIPPGLAYGASGSGPIGPNETLIFVVDLLKVE